MNGFSFVKWFFPIFAFVFEKEENMSVKKAIKRLFTAVVLLAVSMTAAMAQDIIVKQDGETIKTYRTDVGKHTGIGEIAIVKKYYPYLVERLECSDCC